MTQLDFFNLLAPAEPEPEPRYLVRGFYMDPATGYDADPGRASNSVAYANLTRRQVLKDYASPDELDDWLASGERRHTAKACLWWDYTIEQQAAPLTFDPVTRTYMEQVPPFEWDEAERKYVRA